MTSRRAAALARKTKQSFDAKYDAAGTGRRIRSWNPPTSGPNRAIQGLQKIRDRSRDSTRNDWAAASLVQKWATTLVGVAITPRWEEKKFNDAWAKHVPTTDADGVLDAYGQQTLGVRSWIDGGEVFLRRRPRALTSPLSAPVQYQLIEAEYVPIFDSDVWPGMPEGNTIRQGIERNKYGERTAYWMYREHPGEGISGTVDATKLIRVVASQVKHFFEPKRPGQLRGVSELASILVRLRSTMDFEDAVLDRQKLANLFVGFITRPIPDQSDIEFDPDTGLPKFYDDNGAPMRGLEPGIMQELQTGEDVKFANPPEAGTTYSDYIRTTGVGTAAGGGMPYELMSGDIQNVSDRTLRVVIQEFRRFARQRQWQLVIPMLCQPMVDWWVDAMVLSGEFSVAEAEIARKPKWSPEGWEYIHPTQDAQGKKFLIEAGIVSRDNVIAERGDDPRQVDEERKAGKDREDKLGLTVVPPAPVAPAPAPTPKPIKAELHPSQISAFEAQARLYDAQLAQLSAPPPAAPTEESAMEHFIAGLTSQMVGLATAVTALAAKPTEIHNHVEPTPLNVNVEAPDVHIENKVEPTPISVAVDVPAPVVNVAAPTVNVTNEVQPADVNVNLPDRKTTSVIDRDRDGNITEVTQTETNLH